MTITLNSGSNTLIIDEVDGNNSRNWKVIKSEEYKPNKDEWVLARFRKDFPKQASQVKDAKLVFALCSRSSRLSKWLRDVSVEYVLEITPPNYLKDIVNPTEFKIASEAIVNLNKINKIKAEQTAIAVTAYNDAMSLIEKEAKEKSKVFMENKLVRILSLNSQSLPITLQLMIENFTPSVGANSPDKFTYAREVLVNFKISLIKYFNVPENKNKDIEEFLKEISEK